MAIALRCTYCHDGLDRLDARYCAACLAPHHPDCHLAYAGCATYGCGERATVRPREFGRRLPRVSAPPARPPRSRGPILVVGAVGIVAGIASVAAGLALARRGAPSMPEVPAAPPSGTDAAPAPPLRFMDCAWPATLRREAPDLALLHVAIGDRIAPVALVRGEALLVDPAEDRSQVVALRAAAAPPETIAVGAPGPVEVALAGAESVRLGGLTTIVRLTGDAPPRLVWRLARPAELRLARALREERLAPAGRRAVLVDEGLDPVDPRGTPLRARE